MNKNTVFFAFAKGKESTDAPVIKRYTGIAPVTIVCVNPNKAQMESTLGINVTDEVNYVGEVDVDGKKVANARISFWLQPVAEKIGMEVSPINMTMFIRNEYRYNGDKTKVQVIDKYGRTAWVTVEQAKAHEIPMYSNGPAKIDAGYRPAYVGEEDLVAFFKTFLGIPNVDVYNKNTGTWSTHENPEECEAGLEKIANYFKGDFSELRDIIALQPNNKVKALFGVRTTEDGKQYQAVYPKVLRANATDASIAKLDAEIQERKNNGALSTTEFTFGEFKEYTVEPTTFAPETTTSDMPFAPDSPWG